MLALARQTSFWPFFAIMLVYQLAYIPTLSLTNAIAFHHLPDARKRIRQDPLWGTIGWIAASWPFVFILAGKTGAELHACAPQHLHRRRAGLVSRWRRSR